MQIVLLRVGADMGCGGMLSPLFHDGTFEFLPIPDTVFQVDDRKYGEAKAKSHDGNLSDYFPKNWSREKRKLMSGMPMHVDPEFSTFTYGDPTPNKRGLQSLAQGDLLVFYAGLAAWDFECPDALYIVAYFEIDRVVRAKDHSRAELMKEFGGNFHVRNQQVFDEQQNRLLLYKGGKNSKLLSKAHRIGQYGTDRRGTRLHTLSDEMRDNVFGSFTVLNANQRCAPRWVKVDRLPVAESFIRNLS